MPHMNDGPTLVQILRDGEEWGVPVSYEAGVRYIARQDDTRRFDLVYLETGRLASFVIS